MQSVNLNSYGNELNRKVISNNTKDMDSNTCIKNVESIQEKIKSILSDRRR